MLEPMCITFCLSHLVSRNSLDSSQRAYTQQTKRIGTVPLSHEL